jgi:hypothetical protein
MNTQPARISRPSLSTASRAQLSPLSRRLPSSPHRSLLATFAGAAGSDLLGSLSCRSVLDRLQTPLTRYHE